MTAPAPTQPSGASSLADRFIEHLRQEQAFWSHAHTVLRSLCATWDAGQWQALTEVTPAQDQLMLENDRLRGARRTVLSELGAALGAPTDTLTLERIAAHLPATHGRQVLDLRADLRLRANEVQRLGRACALRAEYHVAFLQRFFTELTGGAAAGRYGPQGTLQPGACRSLLQARG